MGAQIIQTCNCKQQQQQQTLILYFLINNSTKGMRGSDVQQFIK